MSIFQKVVLIITIIGAINWGLIGLFQFDLVAFLLGDRTLFTRIIYAAVGVAGIINIALLTLRNTEMRQTARI